MNQFFTIPNLLTMMRMLLLPVFVLGFFVDSSSGYMISLVVFIFCCLTDYLDGYYARTFRQTTKIGQILDPLADKILIATSVLFISGFNLISRTAIIPASIILCREVIITALRAITERVGCEFKTSKLSKCKTALQMLSISVVLLSAVQSSSSMQEIGEFLLWFSSVIAIFSGCIYLRLYFSTL
jgi:cardiolipin synthase